MAQILQHRNCEEHGRQTRDVTQASNNEKSCSTAPYHYWSVTTLKSTKKPKATDQVRLGFRCPNSFNQLHSRVYLDH